jgi:RNA polymerase-binding transcription factor DksA
MGRGGGGGGSHHSSHHSSSHTHHASSSHSYSSGSSSYRSGSSRYSGGSSGGSGGGGCFSTFVTLIVMAVIAGGVYFGLSDELPQPVQFFLIERSTENREALPESKCTPVDVWYQDDWGDWIDEEGEEDALIDGMKSFYESTGVQPYLWITGEDGGQYESAQSLEDLAEAKYKELFGIDEGHMIVIFREYPNNSSEYICTVTPGYDAETQVMDEQAREILLDFIDYFYTDTDLNEGYFFKYSFKNAGERIMQKQLSFRQMGIIAGVAVILVIGLIITANIVKKRKIAVAKQKTLQAQEAAKQAKAVADQKKTDFNRKKYEDELETQYVAVNCPNCGASNLKIRRTTVGYCDYCGTAIKVDKDGNIAIISGDQAGT